VECLKKMNKEQEDYLLEEERDRLSTQRMEESKNKDGYMIAGDYE